MWYQSQFKSISNVPPFRWNGMVECRIHDVEADEENCGEVQTNCKAKSCSRDFFAQATMDYVRA